MVGLIIVHSRIWPSDGSLGFNPSSEKGSFISSSSELIGVIVNIPGGHVLACYPWQVIRWRVQQAMLTRSIHCLLNLVIDVSFVWHRINISRFIMLCILHFMCSIDFAWGLRLLLSRQICSISSKIQWSTSKLQASNRFWQVMKRFAHIQERHRLLDRP
jgi:hypothetical protein